MGVYWVVEWVSVLPDWGGGSGVDLLLGLTSDWDCLGGESPLLLPIIILVNVRGLSAVPVRVLGGVRGLPGPAEWETE